MKPDPSKTYCESCGQELKPGEKHETVTRVVRAQQKYGAASAGEKVEIEPRFLDQGPIQRATMSLEEHEMLLSQARMVDPAPRAIGKLKQMVEAGLDAAIANTRMQIERGKQQVQWAAQRAAQAASDLGSK